MKSSPLTLEVSPFIRISLMLISVILVQFTAFISHAVAQEGGDARGGDATGEVGNCYGWTIVQAPVGGDARGGNAIGGGSLRSESLARAQITNLYAEHNVWDNGQIGMKIHVSFSQQGLSGKVAQVVAYFFNSGGPPLHSSPYQSASLKTVDNQVSVGTNLDIQHDRSTIRDLQLFMPYSGLNMDHKMSRAHLAFRVVVYDQSSVPPVPLASSLWKFFTYGN